MILNIITQTDEKRKDENDSEKIVFYLLDPKDFSVTNRDNPILVNK